MKHRFRKLAGAGLGLLLILAPVAAAKEKKEKKEKKQRAQVVLPLIVQAAGGDARTFSFREREFWGHQPARYRSTATLAAPVLVPELAALVTPGERLVELQASSRAFSGALYCTARQVNRKARPWLICFADRDGDGAFDQLWRGAAASLKFLVPYPDIRSLRSLEPVRFTRLEDPATLDLQLGFFVSGTNPIFGTHHFYPMLSAKGEVGYPFFDAKTSVTLRDLPRTFGVGGAQIRVEGFQDKQYRATVTRPYPVGERPIVSPYPTETVYVYVPG
jgi:hypothetical protein